jgi:hypothetical protein
MQVESRTHERLVFSPWASGERVKSLIGGLGLVLAGILTLVLMRLVALGAIRSQGLSWESWIAPLAIGVVFPCLGLKYMVYALPLRLEVTRMPLGSRLFWRSWAINRVQLPRLDAVVVGAERGQKGSRYFVLHFRNGNTQERVFRSYDYWWNEPDAVQNATPMAKEIADFLGCQVEFSAPTGAR